MTPTPSVRRSRYRTRAGAAQPADAALPTTTPSTDVQPRFGKAYASAAAPVLDLDDDADADVENGLDFSAFPEVTEFGTPQQLRAAASSGFGFVGAGAHAAAAATPDANTRAATDAAALGIDPPTPRGFRGFLAALDKMPPIRLPIGPAIPWRFGLPALVGLLALMLVLNRPTAHAETQGVRLPASETYAVQQEAPLFQKTGLAQTPATAAPDPSTQTAQTGATDQSAQSGAIDGSSQRGQSAQNSESSQSGQTGQTGQSSLGNQRGAAAQAAPVGVSDNAPTGGTDFLDILLKMVAVLALAYGSLSLLKRAGVGGAAAGSVAKPGAPGSNVRVVTSLALAPNRSVHVLQVAGGKTLLLGATPNQVNLLADLGEVNLDTPGAQANFLDILTSKLGR